MLLMPTVIAILFVSVSLIGLSVGDSNKYADNQQDSDSSEQWLPITNQGDDLISSVPETTTTKHSGGYLYGRQQLVLGPALNVTVRSGDQALMPCIAPHLGDRTVSWIRQKDLAILTTSIHVYTSDPRVELVHPLGSDLWGLQIRQVKTQDEGYYQCQVNTEPKQSRTVVLVVLEQDLKDSPSPPVSSVNHHSNTQNAVTSHHVSKMVSLKVGGNRERYAIAGSTVALVCAVTLHNGLQGKNVELAWWKSDVKLSEIENVLSIHQITGQTGVTAELEFRSVAESDSGSYYCRVEPKYSLSQPTRTIILKEIQVILKVKPEPRDELSSSSSSSLTHSMSLLLFAVCFFIITIKL